MPDDLFHFWNFCKELYPDNPCSMFCNNQYFFTCVRTNATVFVDYFCGVQVLCTSAVFILLLYNMPCNSDNLNNNFSPLIILLVIILLVLIFIDALVDTLDLKLVGPFEILAGAHKAAQNSKPNFHLHWRFFYDPPEFQTILLGSQATQHHIGYYRYSISTLTSGWWWGYSIKLTMIALKLWFTQTYCWNLTEIIQTLSLHSLEKMKRRKATLSHRWGKMCLLQSCEYLKLWKCFVLLIY